eukprot:6212750-Pleurochrysis_carterae.AAC.1
MHDHLQHGNGACEDHSAAAVGGEGGEGGGSGAVPTEALAACAISSDESSACVAGASVDDGKISEREGDGVVGVKEAGVEADGVREERGVWEVKGEGNGVREGAEGEDQGEREVAGVRVAETEEVKLNRGNGVADLTKPELDGIGNGAYEIAPEVRRPNGGERSARSSYYADIRRLWHLFHTLHMITFKTFWKHSLLEVSQRNFATI